MEPGAGEAMYKYYSWLVWISSSLSPDFGSIRGDNELAFGRHIWVERRIYMYVCMVNLGSEDEDEDEV